MEFFGDLRDAGFAGLFVRPLLIPQFPGEVGPVALHCQSFHLLDDLRWDGRFAFVLADTDGGTTDQPAEGILAEMEFGP